MTKEKEKKVTRSWMQEGSRVSRKEREDVWLYLNACNIKGEEAEANQTGWDRGSEINKEEGRKSIIMEGTEEREEKKQYYAGTTDTVQSAETNTFPAKRRVTATVRHGVNDTVYHCVLCECQYFME